MVGHIWAVCWLAAGTKGYWSCLHLQWVISPNDSSQQHYIPSQWHIATLMLFLMLKTHNITGPSESWCKQISAVKTRARCYCRPLLSNLLLQFPQRRLHLSLRLTVLVLANCSFIFTHQLDTPQKAMIQHAAFPVECLPRGLESCRYGGTVRVAFSVLGPDSNGERSSMPSEAMSSTVWGWRAEAAGRLLAAPSLQSARRSSRRLVVWCRVSPGPAAPVTVAWRRRGSAVVPAPLTDIIRGGLWMRAELNAAHSDGILYGKTCSEM